VSDVQRQTRELRGTLSVQEAADLLGVVRRTIHRWQRDGRMPPRIPIGRRLQYRLDDIRAMAGTPDGEQAR
jgi:excisionase family DNA binding protein